MGERRSSAEGARIEVQLSGVWEGAVSSPEFFFTSEWKWCVLVHSECYFADSYKLSPESLKLPPPGNSYSLLSEPERSPLGLCVGHNAHANAPLHDDASVGSVATRRQSCHLANCINAILR